MLYPKIYIKKEAKSLKKYIKEYLETLVDLFSSYSSFTLFLKQKFHF